MAAPALPLLLQGATDAASNHVLHLVHGTEAWAGFVATLRALADPSAQARLFQVEAHTTTSTRHAPVPVVPPPRRPTGKRGVQLPVADAAASAASAATAVASAPPADAHKTFHPGKKRRPDNRAPSYNPRRQTRASVEHTPPPPPPSSDVDRVIQCAQLLNLHVLRVPLHNFPRVQIAKLRQRLHASEELDILDSAAVEADPGNFILVLCSNTAPSDNPDTPLHQCLRRAEEVVILYMVAIHRECMQRPTHWTAPQETRFNTVSVAVGSEEVQVALSSVRWFDGMPNSTILSVTRIENDALHQQYMRRCWSLQDESDMEFGDLETLLCHGTSQTPPSDVAASGVDFRYSNEGLMGRGAYFADNPCYSHSFAHAHADGSFSMLLVRVSLGRVADVRAPEKFRKPPSIDPSLRREARTPHDYAYLYAVPGGVQADAVHYWQKCPVRDTQSSHNYVVYETGRSLPVYMVQYRPGRL